MFGKKITKTIFIEGMSCGHCYKRVEEGLKSVDGVKFVSVFLGEKKAKVVLKKDIADEILKDTVQDMGFEVVDIKEETQMLAKEVKIKTILKQRSFIENGLSLAPHNKDGDPSFRYIGYLYPENARYFRNKGYDIWKKTVTRY